MPISYATSSDKYLARKNSCSSSKWLSHPRTLRAVAGKLGVATLNVITPESLRGASSICVTVHAVLKIRSWLKEYQKEVQPTRTRKQMSLQELLGRQLKILLHT